MYNPNHDEILAETGNEIVASWYKVMLDYFNNVLFHFPAENNETVADFAIRFLDDLDNFKNLNLDENCKSYMDEAYDLFLQVIVDLPSFQGIPENILAIILAIFFHENFSYLPLPPDVLQAPQRYTCI